MVKLIMKMFLYLTIILFVFIVKSLSVDWCDAQSKYCAEGKKHIGCEDTLLQDNCTHMSVIPMSDAMKGYILNNHNTIRNDIAGGNVSPFLSGSRMRQLAWNDDLAALAEIHVKHCRWAHDQCRNTPKHHHVGQNIGEIKNKKKSVDYQDRVTRMIKFWYKEKRFCDRDELANYTATNPKEIRHFTTMILDTADEIGCGYITFETDIRGKHWHAHMMTCNYAFANFKHMAIYKTGTPCSDCAEFNETCSQTYPNLCTKIPVT